VAVLNYLAGNVLATIFFLPTVGIGTKKLTFFLDSLACVLHDLFPDRGSIYLLLWENWRKFAGVGDSE
jgi:hypothetical protein